jgi:hypothetical protein
VANNRDLERRVETRKLRVAAGATLLHLLKHESFIFLGNEEKREQEKERMMWESTQSRKRVTR